MKHKIYSKNNKNDSDSFNEINETLKNYLARIESSEIAIKKHQRRLPKYKFKVGHLLHLVQRGKFYNHMGIGKFEDYLKTELGISKVTGYNYIYSYKFLKENKQFNNWFQNDFQVLCQHYGIKTPVELDNSFLGRDIYQLLRKHNKKKNVSVRNRLLKKYCEDKIKARAEYKKKKQELIEHASKIKYTKTNLREPESKKTSIGIPIVDGEKAKTYINSVISNTKIDISFDGRIVIGPTKSLIEKSALDSYLTIEDKEKYMENDIQPLVEDIIKLIITHKRKKGYKVNDQKDL